MAYFPAANSPQRLSVSVPAASTSKKVPLRPGHSLMDWIRLTKSGVDLRGTGHRLLKIPPEELRKHNRLDDAWMSIHGLVFNVTRYMDYHPGGAAELMRGAGKDATQLFEDVHRWVNFDSMLKACLIGKLDSAPVAKLPSASLLAPPSNTLQTAALPSAARDESDTAASAGVPAIRISADPSQDTSAAKTTWYQSEEHVTLVFCTKCRALDNRTCVVCDVEDDGRRLRGEIFADERVFIVDVALEKRIRKELTVKLKAVLGNIEIRLFKEDLGVRWISVGKYGRRHGVWVPRSAVELRYRQCTLVEKLPITHDTALYRFSLARGSHMVVPLGCHVYLQADVEGMMISRPYTVVLPSLLKDDAETEVNEKNFYVMIKVYEGGVLTPLIDKLSIGGQIAVSNYEGQFSMSVLPNNASVLMLAAGTGLTPMIRLIHFLTRRDNASVQLMFFNKSRRDILWQDQLQLLQDFNPSRFKVAHVLSKPDANWDGLTGHITLDMIKNATSRTDCERQHLFVFVCGPTPFTDLALKFLKDMGLASTVHAFVS